MATTKKSAAKKARSKKSSPAKASAKKRSNGELDAAQRNQLSDSSYAFPKERKEPLNDASHVRNAIARFDQTKGVTDEEREQAFRNIKTAADKFGVEVPETHWQDLGKKPHTTNPAHKS